MKLSPAQAVVMAKIEARDPETVDGWACIDGIPTMENARTFHSLIRNGYLEIARDRVHSYARILKGP